MPQQTQMRYTSKGHSSCNFCGMGDELQVQIEQLQDQIAVREKDYINAVNFHEKYETLKDIRKDIRELKKRLASLYNAMKGDGEMKHEE